MGTWWSFLWVRRTCNEDDGGGGEVGEVGGGGGDGQTEMRIDRQADWQIGRQIDSYNYNYNY